jgi:VWFA-related protein
MLKTQLSRAVVSLITATVYLNTCVAAFSQQPTATPSRSERVQRNPEEQDDVVRVNSNLVQVDTVVLDKRGQQVINLQAADFEIVEDGRARRPEYCSYVSISEANDPNASSNGRLSANEVRRSTVFIAANPLIELKNNVFSDLRPFDTSPSSLLLSTVVTDARATAKMLTRFVDQQMGPHDLAAIRESEGPFSPFAGLTTDRSILHAAIERVKIDPLKKASRIVITLGGGGVAASEWVQQNLRVIQMMSDAVDQLEKLPGRRLLVLLSRGMLYGERRIVGAETVSSRMHELIARANRAKVTVYTLNSSGPDPANLWGGGLQDNGGLITLAQETGGRAIFNTNDLTEGFASVLEENRGYYLLGYNPGQEAVARPHNVQVTVRQPGMRVQARRTAYAQGIGMRSSTSRPQLVDVLTSPLAYRAVKLSFTPLFLSPDGKSARVMSLLNIDLTNVDKTSLEDGSQAINLDIIGQVTAPDGRIIHRKVRNYSLSIPRADFPGMLSRGIDYWFDVQASTPGHYQISIAVRDAKSGRAGNQSAVIEVVDLSRGRLSASSVLVSQVSEESASTSVASLKEDDYSAFSIREFPVGGTLRYQFYVYNSRVNQSTGLPGLQVQVTIKRDGVIQATTPARIVSPTDSQVVVGGDVMLGTLPPATYTLEVTITDMLSKGARTVASSTFQIIN